MVKLCRGFHHKYIPMKYYILNIKYYAEDLYSIIFSLGIFKFYNQFFSIAILIYATV